MRLKLTCRQAGCLAAATAACATRGEDLVRTRRSAERPRMCAQAADSNPTMSGMASEDKQDLAQRTAQRRCAAEPAASCDTDCDICGVLRHTERCPSLAHFCVVTRVSCSTNEIDKYKFSDALVLQPMVTSFSCTAAYPKGACPAALLPFGRLCWLTSQSRTVLAMSQTASCLPCQTPGSAVCP